MPANEPLQHYQPRPIFSTWLGIVLLFAFFALLAFAFLKAAPRGNTYEKKRAEARAKKLEEAQKENFAALTTYAWVDKTKGVARIPINDAMQIMLRELPDKRPTAAGPIAAASPSAAPETSPASSPAASASASTTPAPSVGTTPKPTSVSGEHSEAHNQPAAATNPPPAPPNTQPGASASPAASASSPSAKAPANPSPSVAPSAPGTPLPVRGKTP